MQVLFVPLDWKRIGSSEAGRVKQNWQCADNAESFSGPWIAVVPDFSVAAD